MKTDRLKFFLSIFLFLTTFLLVQLENQKREQKILGLETRLKADQEIITAWEQILDERPDYRDGWIRLTIAYYQTGNLDKAQETLKKAKELDPTNEIVLNLEKLLTR